MDAATEAARSEAERRGGSRPPLPLGRLCHIAVRPLFRPRRAVLGDVSGSGVALLLPEALRPGTPLLVQLWRGAGRRASLVLGARVAYATPLPCGGWRVGCALTRPLSDR